MLGDLLGDLLDLSECDLLDSEADFLNHLERFLLPWSDHLPIITLSISSIAFTSIRAPATNKTLLVQRS